MAPAVPTTEVLVALFITGALGRIIFPTDLCQAFPQVGGRIHIKLEDGPSPTSQQGLAQLAKAQLTSQLAFGATVQALVVIVGSWQSDDVITMKEPRPIAFTQSQQLFTELDQPGAEVSGVG